MSDLFGNHIVGFPMWRLILCSDKSGDYAVPNVFKSKHGRIQRGGQGVRTFWIRAC